MIYVRVGLAIAVGMPIAVVGLLLMASGIGMPVGLVVLGISGMPLARVVRKHNERTSEGPLDQGDKPWE